MIPINPGRFQLCKYAAIYGKVDDEREVPIFIEEKLGQIALPSKNIVFGVIAGQYQSSRKKIKLVVRGLGASDAADCTTKPTHKGHYVEPTWVDSSMIKTLSVSAEAVHAEVGYKYTFLSNDGSISVAELWKYFWLPNIEPDEYLVKTESCRWQHETIIKVYPDIEWKAAFVLRLEDPFEKTKYCIKAKDIFERAKSKAKEREAKEVAAFFKEGQPSPKEFRLSLIVGYGTPKIEHEIGKDWLNKMRKLLDLLMKIKTMAEKVRDSAGGKASGVEVTAGVASSNIMSPVVGAEMNWKFERDEENPNFVSPLGVMSFSADPIIGAELKIDLLEIVGKINPIVLIIKKGVDLALNQLKGKFTLSLTFYGRLNIAIDALTFNGRTKEIFLGRKAKESRELEISGEMGVKLGFKLKFDGELKFFEKATKISFAAEAKADAYLGGVVKAGVDDKGVFIDGSAKFSGLLLTAKIEGKAGWFKHTIEFKSDPVMGSEEIALGRFHFDNHQ